jgi:AraC-like DNA-binding protein
MPSYSISISVPRTASTSSAGCTKEFYAATAASEVGYESASQFNREYSRLVGQPLIRDIKALRAADISATGLL